MLQVARTKVSEVSERYTEVSRGEMKKMFTTRCPQPKSVAKRDASWGTTGNLIDSGNSSLSRVFKPLAVFRDSAIP